MDNNEIGALWLGETKDGTKYMKGKCNGEDIVIFRNKYKKEDKHPDYRILKAMKKEESKPQIDDSVPF